MISVSVLSPKTVEAASATNITIAKKATVKVGSKKKLSYKLTPGNASAKIQWSSSNGKVAKVTGKGVVKGIKKGTVTITAKVKGTNVTAKCKVMVKNVKVKSITAKAVSLKLGESHDLKPTVKPDNATNKKLKYTSSNTKVATVGKSNGKIVAKGAGTCNIKIAASDGSKKTKTIKVTVDTVKATKIAVGQTAVGLEEGGTSQINVIFTPANTTDKGLTYVSDNTGIATVSSTGLIKAVRKGTATITVKTKDGSNKSATVKVTVDPILATSMTASMSKTELVAGETVQISASVAPSNASVKTFKYTSSDPYAATVSNTGLITALAQGFTTITVETVDGSNIKKTFDLTIDYDRSKVDKVRTIITTDMEIDDWNSLIRVFYYLNEFDVAALVQTASTHHWEGVPDAASSNHQVPFRWPGKEQLWELIDEYEKIYPNLRVHDPNYPTPNYVRSITKIGNIGYVGEMLGATDGSNIIRDVILKDVFDESIEKLYIQHWGGHNTTAMALKQIKDEYGSTDQWDAILNNARAKIVMTCYDLQDSVYGSYIEPNWPGLLNLDVGGAYDYRTTGLAMPEDDHFLRAPWLHKNIVQNHGPLLAKYATYLDGTDMSYDTLFRPTMVEGVMEGRNPRANRHDFMSEGDTLCYLLLIDRGLRNLEDYRWGGWSGRLVKVDKTVGGVQLTNNWQYKDEGARDNYPHVANMPAGTNINDARHSSNKWIGDTMRDFAMRADWGITPNYSGANHLPSLTVKVGNLLSTAEEKYDLTAAPGEQIVMYGLTSDPDGNYVGVDWFNYLEAGTYKPRVDTSLWQLPIGAGPSDSTRAVFTVPEDAQEGETIHIICRATDDGSGNPRVYRRIVITVTQTAQEIGSMTINLNDGVTNNEIALDASASVRRLGITIRDASGNTMTNKSVTWSTSDESVATITKSYNSVSGAVTCSMTLQKQGTFDLIATANDGSGKTATITLSVLPIQATSLNATMPTMELIAGETVQIDASVLPATATIHTLKYTSSDPYAAEVSETGLVTALAQGYTTITVETMDGSGLKKTFDVSVDYDRANVDKVRTIITTDMEIDDWNSLIRVFYYLNEFDVAALVQTASTHHWEGVPDAASSNHQVPFRWPGKEQLWELIDEYEKIYPNLRVHDPNYPTTNYVRSITKIGNIGYVGEMLGATDGSDIIKDVILKDAFDDSIEKLYIQHWGGHNTTAMALKQIKDEYGSTDQWDAILNNARDKIVMTCYDLQDSVYGSYIEPNWPGLLNLDVGGAYDYRTTGLAMPEDDHFLRAPWLHKNIVQNHGPLLAKYATYLDGTDMSYDTIFRPTMVEGVMEGRNPRANRHDFMSEGDTLCYLLLIDRGLRNLEDYRWGGWSGRLVKVDKTVGGVQLTNNWQYKDESTMDNYPHVANMPVGTNVDDARHSSNKWIGDTMRDFAMRADWGITPNYSGANHLPSLTVKVGNLLSTAEEKYDLTAAPGEQIVMYGLASDPDGNYVGVDWFNYLEAGTYKPRVDTSLWQLPIGAGPSDSTRAVFTVPEDAQEGETIHIICRATDDGSGNPRVYRRIVITVAQTAQEIGSMTINLNAGVTNNEIALNASASVRRLGITIRDASGNTMTNKSVTWSTSDESVATITKSYSSVSGAVTYSMTLHKQGTFDLIATANDGSGKTITVTLTVT